MNHWAFLWITDLHFASPDSNYSDDPKELDKTPKGEYRDGVFRDSVIDEFHELLDFDFRGFAGNGCADPLSFIALGGDITTHGRQEGLDKFRADTLWRLEKLVSAPEAICIVPGNHDVVWNVNPTAPGYFSQKFEPFVNMIGKSGMTSCFYPKGQLEAEEAEKEGRVHDKKLNFNLTGKSPIYANPDKRVLVMNINSSMRCGELNLRMAADLEKLSPAASSGLVQKAAASLAAISREDFHADFWRYLTRDVAQVTQAQIAKLRTALKEEKKKIGDAWDSYLRVALMHHHLAPFPGQKAEQKGYEATVDSAAVLDLLTSFGFHMVLTGHKHQPYVLPYRFRDREIVILGGPTVGGQPPDGAFRGFHYVEVSASHHGWQVSLVDIPYDISKGDLEAELRERLARAPKLQLSANAALMAAAAAQGLRYRDVVSITSIRDDGDAHRLVECDDVVVTAEGPHTEKQTIHLPPTSGYLDMLRPGTETDGLEVLIARDIPKGHESKSATIELEFSPPLRVNGDGKLPRVSYQYEWFAMNSFALDNLQFVRKYGTRMANKRKVEFTHYIPVDPIERLTVIVQFPDNLLLPQRPMLRIMRVDEKNEDSRSWETDKEETAHLEEMRALRYFKTLNVAALRVRMPKKGLSYGIEWKLPEAPKAPAPHATAKLIECLRQAADDTLKRAYRLLNFSRSALLSGWSRDLDVTLMIFNTEENGAGSLKAIAAGFNSGPARKGNEAMQRLGRESEVVLQYGEGVAGRAFKANEIRIYEEPAVAYDAAARGRDPERWEPNVYKPIPGTITHKALISFPVHLPVRDAEFARDWSIYEDIEPYGVLNIGSGLEGCPVGQLALPSRTPLLLDFQHRINKTLARGYVSDKKGTSAGKAR